VVASDLRERRRPAGWPGGVSPPHAGAGAGRLRASRRAALRCSYRRCASIRSHRFKLANIYKACELFGERADGVMKIVITP
jgi:hypothetical protein